MYLLHGFIINGIRYTILNNWMEENGQNLSFCLITAILVAYLLSSNSIRLFTQPLIELRASKMRDAFKIV